MLSTQSRGQPLLHTQYNKACDNTEPNGRSGKIMSTCQNGLSRSQLLKMNHRLFQAWAKLQLKLEIRILQMESHGLHLAQDTYVLGAGRCGVFKYQSYV